MGSEATGLCGD